MNLWWMTVWLTFPCAAPPSRLRHHDGRLHNIHQRVHLHRQLPAYQPSHRVWPAQPAQLLRPEDRDLGAHGDGLTIRRINYFFSINMSSLKKKIIIVIKKKYLNVFFANFFGSSPSCWHEKIWRWIGGGRGISLGGLKENTGVLLFIFLSVCANNAGSLRYFL